MIIFSDSNSETLGGFQEEGEGAEELGQQRREEERGRSKTNEKELGGKTRLRREEAGVSSKATGR